MPFTKGQPGGPGRKPTHEKFERPIARAKKQIADHLPELIDNMLHLANGGYERVEEEWLPARLVTIGNLGITAFPDKKPDDLVLVKRKVSIADKDRAANQYLIDRILGKPTERQELSGPDGKPIEVTSAARDAAAKELEQWRKQMTAELSNMPSAPPMPPTSSTDTE